MKRKTITIVTVLFWGTVLIAGCGTPPSAKEEEGTLQTETSTYEEDRLDSILTSGDDISSRLSALQAINPDVYAWVEITSSDISFPVLQSEEDAYFYLDHNINGEADEDGCIYTEYYNRKDFTDFNTVIYGRNREDRFGKLHQFQDRDFFDAHREVKICLTDKTLSYRIFAAYTYDDRHLIATYDFSDSIVFENYLEDIFAIRAMDAFIDSGIKVTAEDRIITLSTGVAGQDDKRYLVQAVLLDE